MSRFIDVHNHAIPRRVLELVTSDPVYGVTVADGMWNSGNIVSFPLVDAWFEPDAKLREMDGKELDGAVLSAAPKPLYYYELDLAPQEAVARETNIGLEEFTRGHEDRLRWMAQVPLAFPERAAEVLRDASELGCAGVQIGTTAAGRQLDGPEFEAFWSAAEELDQTVFLHPAYERKIPEYSDYHLGVVVGLPVEVTVAVERLICSHVFDRHPNLRVVAALGGGFFPYNNGRLRHYSSFGAQLRDAPKEPWDYVGQLKFDSFLHDVGQLRFLITQAGAENVLIGTDCSFLSATPTPVSDLRAAADGDETVIQQVGETNPAQLFRF